MLRDKSKTILEICSIETTEKKIDILKKIIVHLVKKWVKMRQE